ncbi:MAG: DUF4920 domain-containing protein [Flavobacteriales bacterium]|nr:DUF4920 domain-containing protein [Flavobacteriales bacterium]
MKKFMMLAATGLFLASCGGGTEAENKEEKKDSAVVEHVAKYGDTTITEEGAISMPDFITAMNGKDSLEVKINANINQCCKKKGCWMTVDMENGEEMRVTFKDYGFFVPKNADGMNATFQGWAFVDTLSVEMQKHYLQDEGASQEEIDAITEPVAEWSFVANGVIIKDAKKK